MSKRRCLPRWQKLPADRFASAAEFAAALSNEAFTGGVRATRVLRYEAHSTFKNGRSALALAAMLAGLVLGVPP